MQSKKLLLPEVQAKIELIRESLSRHQLSAVRFRGVDWFAWSTGGGSSVVIQTAEIGIAEVLITPSHAFCLTDTIESARLKAEQLPADFEIFAHSWPDLIERENFVQALAPGKISSDRPLSGETEIPSEILRAKRMLLPEEIARYEILGRDTAVAMSQTLQAARPDWTENQLAAEGARALLSLGIDATLVLAAGERRVQIYRHPLPSDEHLGSTAMLVFCARRNGLYANLTRFASFKAISMSQRKLIEDVARVEARAFAISNEGTLLSNAYSTFAKAYADLGYSGEHLKHHQGGTTGYLSREEVANPNSTATLNEVVAIAWNPSLPGVKIEDTVLLENGKLRVLTVDPSWPTFEVEGIARPDWWVSA